MPRRRPVTLACGSSPRVRGARLLCSQTRRRSRFIPACAGSAGRDRVGRHSRAVHPRVCGERIPAWSPALRPAGSSPRVRGARCQDWGIRPGIRFIPACAGSARRPRLPERTPPVHPRVCGERSAKTASKRPPSGSSPRVRGARRSGLLKQHRARFIPACAGSAPGRGSSRPPRPVHPRVCGERQPPVPLLSVCSGSSPRVRGAHSDGRGFTQHKRFIPACAGSARRQLNQAIFGSVHPRVCGERTILPAFKQVLVGSSPRVRGAPVRRTRKQAAHRFIPACAGSASAPALSIPACSVHPRVCGERSKSALA